MNILIIGQGRFGQFLKHIFTAFWADTQVTNLGRSDCTAKNPTYIDAIQSAEIIFPAVPIRSLPEVYQLMAQYIRPETTVIDIASIKVQARDWAFAYLPKGQLLIMSHPMFGPDGTKNGKELFGKVIMAENLSAPEQIYLAYKKFWQRNGVIVEEMTSDQHDQLAAYSIGINHYIGRISERLDLHPTPIDTPGFRALCKTFHHVWNDSWELFTDMMTLNPYAVEMRKKFTQAVADIEERLDK